MDTTKYLLSSDANSEHLRKSIEQVREGKVFEPFPEALASIPRPVQRSRNYREGFYAGKRSGKHYRRFAYSPLFAVPYPFSMQVKALNRIQRKQEKMSEGEM